METKCYYVIASIVAVFFSYWYRPAFRVVPKHEDRTFILPTHCPIGRPATFQLKEGSGNIFQSLIDGQGKSLRDQLGLSSIEHIKSILFEVCPNLNSPVLIENLHAYNFLSVSSKQLLLNNVQEDFAKTPGFKSPCFLPCSTQMFAYSAVAAGTARLNPTMQVVEIYFCFTVIRQSFLVWSAVAGLMRMLGILGNFCM